MSNEPNYHPGGYIPGPSTVPVYLDPEECLIRVADIVVGRFVCSRPSHADRACHRDHLGEEAP